MMINLFQILLGSFRVSPRQPRSFCYGKRTQNHVGPGVALRVPCAVRRLRRRRKLAEPVLSLLEGLRQCATAFPDSAARLGHAKGQEGSGS
ncbi:MAG: hypothetical protein MRJ67_07395 [Nitrospirales bacterium]|nr:hypothetical protein [Nitrospirales bacterium]